MGLTIRERCEKRLGGLKALRQPREADWLEIARLVAPERARFLNSDTDRGRRKGPAVYNSHGTRAFRTLTGGMTSGLSSPSRPWFELGTYDEDLMNDPEAKAWLQESQKRMYAFLAQTNFYTAAKNGYLEMGLFGTESCVMVEDEKRGAVFHALTAGEYWIANGKDMAGDTLYRRVPMSVKQVVDTFGNRASSWVRGAYDRSNYDMIVNCFQAIEPNNDMIPGRLDAAGKPFRSVWWDENDDRTLTLRVSGYEEQPMWISRWDTTGSDTWGSSPGLDALPDLRELQMQTRRKGEAVDWVIYPEKIAPAAVKLKNQPHSIVAAAQVDKDTVLVPWQVPYQIVQAIGQDIERCQFAVDQAAYADLFNAITNMPGVQPRTVEEIVSRNEEKLTQLGPVIERVNTEKLQPALDRVFGMMSRGGLFTDPPESLQGMDLKITFISLLTQMQRRVGISQIADTASFAGSLMGTFPQVGDNLNVDEMLTEFAERVGAPKTIIRSPDEVAAMREQRAQAANAQQMAAMAPAAQQGADAARLLSETDTGAGGNLLQQMLGA